MRQCLVGWWGNNSAPLLELDYVRSWTHQHWPLKGKSEGCCVRQRTLVV